MHSTAHGRDWPAHNSVLDAYFFTSSAVVATHWLFSMLSAGCLIHETDTLSSHAMRNAADATQACSICVIDMISKKIHPYSNDATKI